MDGKVVLITGAGSGIGRATALAFARAGHSLALCGRRSEPLESTATECKSAGAAEALALACDITSSSAVSGLFARTHDSFGRLDVLFNNAGCGAPAVPLEELPEDEWKVVVDTNLTGTFLCSQQAFRLMKAQNPQGGRIINNGSIAAHAPRPMSVAYTATKHGITGLTKSLSLEGRRYRIACGQIDIGNAETERTAMMVEGVPQADGAIRAEPRMSVDDVAKAVVLMASLPLESNVLFMTVMATSMPYVGRG
jgi:NAD(P)-dependent dehydrogenase (short-subunit alcohol dehydrogenase family)